MTKKILVLFFLIAAFISACDPPVFQPTDEGNPPETTTPTNQVIDSDKMSPTGFYWPTGEKPIPENDNWWLDHGCDESGTYFQGDKIYHIGLDIMAPYESPVLAISSGVVIHISESGWGKTNNVSNKGVLVRHYLKDGKSFIALYGHIQTELTKDDVVKAGVQIGTIGDWSGGYHLHLGIFPDGYIDGAHLGRMACPVNYSGKESLDKNGAVNPLDWLNTKYPGEMPQGPIIGAPAGSGTDEGPTIITTIVSATLTPGDGGNEKCSLLQENAIYARLGHHYNTFFVVGDSRVWEAETNFEWPEFDPKPTPINLRHLGNISCVIKMYKEETLPPDYTLSEYDETIGNTQYHVEDFQYASPLHIKKFTEIGNNNPITVVSEDGNQQCFADARQVLLCSELVGFGPLDLPSTSDPLIPSPELDTIAFGYNFELKLTYDKNTWESVDYSGSFKAIKLIDVPDCSMHQNFGRGAPEWWQRMTKQELIGDYDFRVEQWTDTQANQVVLVTYNIDDKNISIAIEPGSEPDVCMEAAREVINYSVLNYFGLVE